MVAVDDDRADSSDPAPAPRQSPVARALTPFLSVALAIIGIVWAGGILLEFGIALITEQVIAAILANALAIAF